MQTDYPEKLVIEPTTRCNFKCEMCVKQSQGCEIKEGDLDDSVFSRCEPLLSHTRSVVFTGIGEPLLNENLETYLALAREVMPNDSERGFQTNGKLLTARRAASLIESGLTQICLSVDSVKPQLFDKVRQGGLLTDVDSAFNSLRRAGKERSGFRLKTGIEFVLMSKNLAELPALVEWAAKRQVDFILVSHLSAYEKSAEKQTAFLNNSHEALALFKRYSERAAQKGIDLDSYNRIRFKIQRSEKEEAVYRLVADFKQEALENDLYVNMHHLVNERQGEYAGIREVFDQAFEDAESAGIELKLPRIRPKTDRYCPFVEENVMFVTWDGHVSPCYFLWHQYAAMRAGYVKQVDPVYFGNVRQTDAGRIWRDKAYSEFRSNVLRYDYPNCHAWCETRCDYVLDSPFYQDCYINGIPCCDCYWALGLHNCLT